jgi:predicted amidohydrolase
MSEAVGNKLYNTAVVVGPEGLIGKHRKMHPSKFETIFEHGCGLDVFDIEGVKIGVTICFDIWIPEAARVLALKGAQVICSPCNFGGPWTLDIARTRAMENKVYSILANRIGQEPMGEDIAHFRGESRIIDYMGDILAQAGDEECVKVVDIEPEEVIKKDTIMSSDLFNELQNYGDIVRYSI